MPVVKKLTKRRKQSTGSVLDRIEEGIDYQDTGISMSIYGKSGTGKTSFWSTFPGPILAICCSGTTKRKSGELRSVLPRDRKKIHPVTLHHTDELNELIDYQTETGKYRTVVLDHTLGLRDLNLQQILGIENLPEQKSWETATRENYTENALQLKTYLRALIDLTDENCNVLIISQERAFNTEGDEGNASDVIEPWVAPNVSMSVLQWMNQATDYTVQTLLRQKVKQVPLGKEGKTIPKRLKGVDYCLRVAPNDTFYCKFRVPTHKERPEVIIDPSYDKVFKLIEGGE